MILWCLYSCTVSRNTAPAAPARNIGQPRTAPSAPAPKRDVVVLYATFVPIRHCEIATQNKFTI